MSSKADTSYYIEHATEDREHIMQHIEPTPGNRLIDSVQALQ